MTGLLPLFRPRLVLGNGIAAVGGYLLFPGVPGLSLLAGVLVAVSLLAAAGSALNQVLERDLDPLMQRTRRRPLPAGRLTAPAATFIGLSCAVGGSGILCLLGGIGPAAMGVAPLLWYLAVYTPLKRRTPFALLAGAICGAAPPVIGWCVAGGGPTDFRIVLLAGILFLWQVPHFWLLQQKHADDYRRAGFKLFAVGTFPTPAPLMLLWMGAMMAGAMMLPAFGMLAGSAAACCAAICAALLLAALRRCESALTACLHSFPLLLTLALCFGK